MDQVKCELLNNVAGSSAPKQDTDKDASPELVDQPVSSVDFTDVQSKVGHFKYFLKFHMAPILVYQFDNQPTHYSIELYSFQYTYFDNNDIPLQLHYRNILLSQTDRNLRRVTVARIDMT